MLTGDTQYIFVDHRLQKGLYQYALKVDRKSRKLRKLFGPKWWEEVFQYPRPIGRQVGIIRHVRKHDNHYHIRFKCPQGDTKCRE